MTTRPLMLPSATTIDTPAGAFRMRLRDLADAANARRLTVPLGSANTIAHGVATDVWTLKPGDLFVALNHDATDMHGWAQAAIQRGAVAILTDQSTLGASVLTVPVVVVDDLWRALCGLTRAHRRALQGKFVAVSDASFDGRRICDFVVQALGGRDRVSIPWRPTPTAGDLLRAVIETTGQHEATVLDFSRVAPSVLPSLVEAIQPHCAVLAAPSGEIQQAERNQAWLTQATGLLKELGRLKHDTAAVVDFDSLACVMASRAAPHGIRLISYGADLRCEFRAVGVALGKEGVSFCVGGLPTSIGSTQPTRWRGRRAGADSANVFHVSGVAQSDLGIALAAIAVGWWAGESLRDLAWRLQTASLEGLELETTLATQPADSRPLGTVLPLRKIA